VAKRSAESLAPDEQWMENVCQRRLLGSVLHYGSGSLYEQRAQVLVSTKGNLPQRLLASSRVLLGNNSQPGGKVAALAECRRCGPEQHR
jgi:hypothetical protein